MQRNIVARSLRHQLFRACTEAVMVTTKSLRYFAADCLALALRENDPSQKQNFVTIARSWAATADTIDRFIQDGLGSVVDDLKQKLD
jgi:hypothetical protein